LNGFHSKIYAIHSDGKCFGVIGSSNLTEHGLFDWVESNVTLSGELASEARHEVSRLWDGALALPDCLDDIPVAKVQRQGREGMDAQEMLPVEGGTCVIGLAISLLGKDRQVPGKSGLNWAFGGGRHRNPNECYIRLPISKLQEAEFVFGGNRPGHTFYAKTHDGETFLLRLEGTQGEGRRYAKQISTDGNKSELGA
jgi:hypothetical protein